MLRRSTALLAFVPAWPFLAGGAVAFETDDASLAITDSVAPVIERYHSKDGVHYLVSDEWLHSLTLGVSLADLNERPLPWSRNNRWLPHFEFYRNRSRDRAGSAWDERTENRMQWFWTFGMENRSLLDVDIHSDLSMLPIDIRSDFISEYSLQTKAGFVVPFGKRWLIGGALTVDRKLADGGLLLDQGVDYPYADYDTDAAAYVGIEWKY